MSDPKFQREGEPSAPAWTPGPWEHEGDVVFVTEYMRLCCGRGYSSCCGDPDIEVERRQIAQCAPENAPLIAAAPDMVAALDALMTASSEEEKFFAYQAALAALAKARAQ